MSSNYKDPLWALAWLETALEMEKEKLSKCPVKRDLLPGHEMAQAWGYVVIAYFLVEESFKALLNLRNKCVPHVHSLTILFSKFETEDKETLREFYSDYWGSFEKPGFPFKTLDGFLENLDGDLNRRGNDFIGSFDWRYFPIQNQQSNNMPFVSVEFLHEIAYGCVTMVEYAYMEKPNPLSCKYSRRIRW